MFPLKSLTRRSFIWSVACLLLTGSVIASGPAVARADLRDGLLGYWPFDGDGADASGNDRPLDLVGEPDFSSGLLGEALHLHGDPSQYATRPWVDDDFGFGDSDFSIQVWVSFDADSGEQTILEQFDGASGPGWTLTSFFGNALQFYADGGAVHLDAPLAGSQVGHWGQIVVRRSGESFQAYYDGIAVGSWTQAGPLSASSLSLLVGRRNEDDGRDFPLNGSLDEIAIWNRALSEGEIGRLYGGGKGVGLWATSLPGDANGDGHVDLADFGILKANFGSGSTLAEGDFDGNSQVDLADFGILKANFGTSGASVPEPGGESLAACGITGLLVAHCRRHRRRR